MRQSGTSYSAAAAAAAGRHKQFSPKDWACFAIFAAAATHARQASASERYTNCLNRAQQQHSQHLFTVKYFKYVELGTAAEVRFQKYRNKAHLFPH